MNSGYGQYTNFGEFKVMFGMTRITLKTNTDHYLYDEGRGIGYCDNFGRPSGKFLFESLSIGEGSEGTPRFSGGLFKRDGIFHAIYENWKPDVNDRANTFYITKYNEDLEMLEENIFVLHPHYRLFNAWATLTDDDAFLVSGYYLNVSPDNWNITTNGGSFVMRLSPDGLPPVLSRKEESLIQARFTVYGNPVSDQFILSTDAPNPSVWKVRVFDIHGRQMAQSNAWQGGRNHINVHHMIPGTYVYTVTEGNRQLFSGKFIKQ